MTSNPLGTLLDVCMIEHSQSELPLFDFIRVFLELEREPFPNLVYLLIITTKLFLMGMLIENIYIFLNELLQVFSLDKQILEYDFDLLKGLILCVETVEINLKFIVLFM
jgi:hypothetical protein